MRTLRAMWRELDCGPSRKPWFARTLRAGRQISTLPPCAGKSPPYGWQIRYTMEIVRGTSCVCLPLL